MRVHTYLVIQYTHRNIPFLSFLIGYIVAIDPCTGCNIFFFFFNNNYKYMRSQLVNVRHAFGNERSYYFGTFNVTTRDNIFELLFNWQHNKLWD